MNYWALLIFAGIASYIIGRMVFGVLFPRYFEVTIKKKDGTTEVVRLYRGLDAEVDETIANLEKTGRSI